MLLDIKERQNGQTGFLRQQDADPVPGSDRVLLPHGSDREWVSLSCLASMKILAAGFISVRL